MLNRHGLAFTVAACVWALPFVASAQSPAYEVIVNAANPTASMTAERLAGVFLKDVPNWADGQAALPVDQSAVASAREAFSQDVFGQSSLIIQSYWVHEMRAGRKSPPPVMKSDQEVLTFVAENVGGVGYVAAGTKLRGKVKVLKLMTTPAEKEPARPRKATS
jgi:ABC-type phosphate transport system substrate-binding protein